MKTILRVLATILVMSLVISTSIMVFADVLTDSANVTIGTTYTLPATVGGKTVNWGIQSTTIDISKQGQQIFTGTTDTGTAKFTLNVGAVGVEAPIFKDSMNYTLGSKPAVVPGLAVVSTDTSTTIVSEPGNATNTVVQLGTGQTGWNNLKYHATNGLTGTDVTIKSKIKFNQLNSIGPISSSLSSLTFQIKNNASIQIANFAFNIATDSSYAYNFANGLRIRDIYRKSDNSGEIFGTITPIPVSAGVNVSSSGTGWMELKVVFNTTLKTYNLYINDVVVLANKNFYTALVTGDTTAMNLQTVAFADRNSGVAAQDIILIDDIGFYTGAVQPTVYFNGTDFPTGLSTSVEQNTATKPSLSATLGLSDSTTRVMPITWTLPDTSKVGKFVTNGYIDGFNTPIPITIDIVKPVMVINQDMESYEIGTALNTLPWHISNPGEVALESGTQNKVLDCTATRNFNTISTASNISGKIKIDYKVKFTGTDFTTFSMGAQNVAGYALAELTISNIGGLFRLVATTRLASAPSTDIYPVLVAFGGINVGDWINMSIVLDTDAKTYDVYYNGNKVGTAIGFRYQYNTVDVGASDPYLNKFSVADRTTTVSPTLHYYIDNICITRYLQVSSVKATTLDVVLDDTAVLPDTVTATLTDLTTTQLMDVTWNSSPNVSQVGVYNITGAVTGFDTPATLIVNVTQYPYVIDSLGFSNSIGQTVLGLTQNGNLDTIKLQKLSSQNYDGVIYVALYENNAIVDIKAIEVSASMDWNKGESKVFAVNKLLDNANVENCTAKAFFFGGSIQPYSVPIVINNSTAPASPLKIYICGDSTAATYTEAQAPLTGWGQVFGNSFDASKVTIDNRAVPGRSSMSFINEGRLSDILSTVQKGDYLFIQFGHNDQRTTEPLVGTDPQTTYKYYLTQYIDGARAKGAIPVLLTPTERAWYTGTNLTRTHTAYQTAMKELALSLKVPLIDITEKCYNYLNPLGEATATTYYIMGATNDRTHFNVSGANLIAELVAQGIQELKLPIANLLN